MDMHNGDTTGGNTCNCPHCKGNMGMDWRTMRAIKMLTAVIVTIFVFWCGVQVGEIKASFGMDRGYGMMQFDRGFTTDGYDASPAMMISTATAVPATGADTITTQGQTTKAQ